MRVWIIVREVEKDPYGAFHVDLQESNLKEKSLKGINEFWEMGKPVLKKKSKIKGFFFQGKNLCMKIVLSWSSIKRGETLNDPKTRRGNTTSKHRVKRKIMLNNPVLGGGVN
jgi:hypothetical protein